MQGGLVQQDFAKMKCQILKQRGKEDRSTTVDGWNPAPVDQGFIYTSQVVRDFFHQQYCGEPTLSPLWWFFFKMSSFSHRWDSLSSFSWRVTTEMKQPYPQKVSLCAFVNPKYPSPSKEPCPDSSYHASGSDPVKWWGNPFKTAKAELGENGKMYFTTDFFLEQSLQKDFKSYIKHCFDGMCFWYVIQFPRTQLTSIFEGQQVQNSNENKGHLASRYIFFGGYSPSQ